MQIIYLIHTFMMPYLVIWCIAGFPLVEKSESNSLEHYGWWNARWRTMHQAPWKVLCFLLWCWSHAQWHNICLLVHLSLSLFDRYWIVPEVNYHYLIGSYFENIWISSWFGLYIACFSVYTSASLVVDIECHSFS